MIERIIRILRGLGQLGKGNRNCKTKLDRAYVIWGDPWQAFEEPNYSTDPRHYGMMDVLFDKPVSDEEFNLKYINRVKVFRNLDDAVSFAGHCNLVSVICPVFDCLNGQWVSNSEETSKVADEIADI